MPVIKNTRVRLPILKIALLAVNNFVVMLASRCQIAWLRYGAIKVLSQSDKMKNEVYGLGVLFLLLIPE